MHRVLDATVIFWLHRADLIAHLLALGERVCVVDYLAHLELIEPDGRLLLDQGLAALSLSEDDAIRAERWQQERPRLSLSDVYSAALAQSEGRELATHDGELRELCRDQRIPFCGIAEVVLTMAEAGVISRQDVERFRAQMHRDNCDYHRPPVKRALKIAPDELPR